MDIPTNDRISLAGKWLLSSSIRNQDPRDPLWGSVNNSNHPKRGKFPFAYSEITGYAISCFVHLAGWLDQAEYLDAARQAGDYLLRIQNLQMPEVYGAFVHSQSLSESGCREEYYAFDVAMCIDGLLDLYSITGEKKYLSASEMAGHWLVEKMQQADGSFLALYDVDEHRFGKTELEKAWYYDGGCLHAKIVISLLKLARTTGELQYQYAAKRTCDWALQLQDADGAFWRGQQRDYVFTHAHCYATEGFLYAAWALKNEAYLQAAVRSSNWLLLQQDRLGALDYEYKHHWIGTAGLAARVRRQGLRVFLSRKRNDATAQAVRIWMLLYANQQDERYRKASQKAICYLNRMQRIQSANRDLVGGVSHGSIDFLLFQKRERVSESWCTMFFASALHLYKAINEGGYPFSEAVGELF